MIRMTSLLIFVMSVMGVGVHAKTLTLKDDNTIVIMGVVDDAMDANVKFDLTRMKGKTIYVYIDSPGGSVGSGLEIIKRLKDSKKELVCIAHRAYSMGSVIFESCDKRYMLPEGKLMFHRMSMELSGPAYELFFYVTAALQLEDVIFTQIANRVGLEVEPFFEELNKELWMNAEVSIKRNFADGVVTIERK